MHRTIIFTSLLAGVLATNEIVGFEGCDATKTAAINEAFAEAKLIFDVVRSNPVNWDGIQASEYLGPSAFTRNMQEVIQGEQERIQGIVFDIAKVNGGSFHDDYKINVRCDDWDNDCDGTIAYTDQRGPDGSPYDKGSIVFCPSFFDHPSLAYVVNRGRSEYDWQRKYSMRSYSNARAVTFIHELLHIDWIASAERYGPNLHIIDWNIEFYDNDDRDHPGRRVGPFAVYGARLAKTLARWNDKSETPQPGRKIARSAENLALYMLAMYLTQELGAYPHLPIVNTEPRREPNFHNENAFEIDDENRVWGNETYVHDEPGVNFKPDDIETALITEFHSIETYSKEYQDLWHHWANPLTQSTHFHNELHDGWINTATMMQSTVTSHDVRTPVGSSAGVWDGWVKYWSPSCPNAEATFMWPSHYDDVYLKADGYLHDAADNRIGTIRIEC